MNADLSAVYKIFFQYTRSIDINPSKFLAGVICAVRGMMYYRRALELQAFLDMATEDGKDVFIKILFLRLTFLFVKFCSLLWTR